jgi:hypothetical protein
MFDARSPSRERAYHAFRIELESGFQYQAEVLRTSVLACSLTASFVVGCAEEKLSPLATGGGGGTGGASVASVSASSTGSTGGALPTGLASSIASTRFVTADHMRASIEMQLSGEPFAELLGRDLGGYDRFSDVPDRYVDPADGISKLDPLGFSLAVESYEYSKQPMNQLSFESGAGLSLQFAPRLNPASVTGQAAVDLLLARLQRLALESRASGAKAGRDFVLIPPPAGDPGNPYGWGGIRPVFAEFRSFDPAIAPSVGADHQCSLAGAIDEPLPPGTIVTYVGDYECDARTLGLVNRDAAVDKVLEPAALGYATWKQALWVINYWSSLHDVDQHPIVDVASADRSSVGLPDNQVVGRWIDPTDPSGTHLVFGKNGTYLGDVSLEGFQGLLMLDEIDEKSRLLLGSLAAGPNGTLGPVVDAVDYDYEAPLVYFPAAVAVTEVPTATSPDEAFARFEEPTAFTVDDRRSRLVDLSGVLGGFAEVFATTDPTSVEVGGTLPFAATFDGDPFAADDGAAGSEDTLHDRALAIEKIALVDLDRLHFDPGLGALVDEVEIAADGTATRSTHASTLEAAYAIVALRQARRALDGSLALYSNDTPDVHGVPLALDGTRLRGAPSGGLLADRIDALITAEADLLADRIVDEGGLAAVGYDLALAHPDASPPTVEAQAAAVRGLLEAYLATSDEHYRARAVLAYEALESQFWMSDVRTYRTTLGVSSTMEWTPSSFGVVHGALRQFWKLWASRPGNEALSEQVLARIVRQMKLVVNGFDDADGDGLVGAGECLEGRLQMAERALTGERAIASDGGDRDKDCVPDISFAHLPASLAAKVVLVRR